MSPKKFKSIFRYWDHTGRWHPWYAWRPVQTIGGEWRWFSTVYRRQFVGAHHSSVGLREADLTFWAYGNEFDYIRDYE